jgi:hypothetical protein
MRIFPLVLVLAACVLFAGCDNGSGPAVGSPTAAKEGGASEAPPTTSKIVNPKTNRKPANRTVQPKGPE